MLSANGLIHELRSIAKGSLMKIQTHLLLAQRVELLTETDFSR
jgi:hypothetical protein